MSRWLTSSMGPPRRREARGCPRARTRPGRSGGCVEAEHGPVRDDDGRLRQPRDRRLETSQRRRSALLAEDDLAGPLEELPDPAVEVLGRQPADGPACRLAQAVRELHLQPERRRDQLGGLARLRLAAGEQDARLVPGEPLGERPAAPPPVLAQPPLLGRRGRIELRCAMPNEQQFVRRGCPGPRNRGGRTPPPT